MCRIVSIELCWINVSIELCMQPSCCVIDYMNQKLEVQKNWVPDLCKELSKTYGTIMAGLKVSINFIFYEIQHPLSTSKV